MTWVRFFFKLLIAMLGPAGLAFAMLLVWSKLFQKAIYSDAYTLGELAFGVLFYCLFCLSIFLPILLTIREIQNHSLSGESPLQLTTIKTSTDKLWK